MLCMRGMRGSIVDRCLVPSGWLQKMDAKYFEHLSASQ